MFVNISNHPSDKWSEKQIEAAKKWGNIVDIEHPFVDPFYTEEEIVTIAQKVMDNFRGLCYGDCVHLMGGEPLVSWYIIDNLSSQVACVYSVFYKNEFVNFRYYGINLEI